MSTVPPMITTQPVLIRQRRPRRRSRRQVLVVICPIPPPTTSHLQRHLPNPQGHSGLFVRRLARVGRCFVLLLQTRWCWWALRSALGLYVLLRIESVVGDELDRH